MEAFSPKSFCSGFGESIFWPHLFFAELIALEHTRFAAKVRRIIVLFSRLREDHGLRGRHVGSPKIFADLHCAGLVLAALHHQTSNVVQPQPLCCSQATPSVDQVLRPAT